ncbi:MAG: Rrf2 family iron-sulfur cluster assembly transcriptional regulator [Phycisphaerales bacterium]|jgi:Rrf2 family iron-sulfur cluster assembly transcriptional regulator
MPSLAQGTGYATLALGYIASAAGKPVLVRAVAEACDLPAPYLSKIINRLSRAGLVNTQRGVNGGVVLAKDATTITLRDVCIALDDPVIAKRCLLGTEECSDERACPAHKFSAGMREQMLDYLDHTTIADISAFELNRRWADAQGHATNGNPPTTP